MDPILRFIEQCNEKALTREQDAKRTAPLEQDDDPRVDICIYFLSPHRVKPIDTKFMSELSLLAPVVPVLAKADSMTTDELQHFRSAVQQALTQVDNPACYSTQIALSRLVMQAVLSVLLPGVVASFLKFSAT